MANVLPVQTQQAILALHAQGRSIRRIARELGIHRNTVRGYLEGLAADSKCTTLCIRPVNPIYAERGMPVAWVDETSPSFRRRD